MANTALMASRLKTHQILAGRMHAGFKKIQDKVVRRRVAFTIHF